MSVSLHSAACLKVPTALSDILTQNLEIWPVVETLQYQVDYEI